MQSIVTFCRMLRQRETPAEKLLWSLLRNRQLVKHKFLRQYPICVTAFGYNRYYIPDFYCHQAKLVIEADGPIHLLKKEYNENRDLVLQSFGLTILRFDNDQILKNTDEVLNTIIKYLNKSYPPTNPLYAKGEEMSGVSPHVDSKSTQQITYLSQPTTTLFPACGREGRRAKQRRGESTH